LDLLLIPSFVATMLFHYAGKILWPLDYQARYPKRKPPVVDPSSPAACC